MARLDGTGAISACLAVLPELARPDSQPGVFLSLVMVSNWRPFLATNSASLSATECASLEPGAVAAALVVSGQSSGARVSSAPACAFSGFPQQGAAGCQAVQVSRVQLASVSRSSGLIWHRPRRDLEARGRCPSERAWPAAQAQARHHRCLLRTWPLALACRASQAWRPCCPGRTTGPS